MVCDKSLAVLGFGDIGAECAKVCKAGFDMKVWGIKRNP
jgi:lactate dehydrogenase-like 2-hydroxyacid dehydrogenase